MSAKPEPKFDIDDEVINLRWPDLGVGKITRLILGTNMQYEYQVWYWVDWKANEKYFYHEEYIYGEELLAPAYRKAE